ncbi:hypothetical protein ACFWYW_27370 [Nonomuraea sp. NPDC059023]|uniref:hypothetical protein n=1 Tax=unclassified Nonomuraea TaxID=2593643 RepID=UPI0036869232
MTMPKKPLGEPKAPYGPQYDFFDLLQRTIRRHDDPSLRELGLTVHRSRAVIHRYVLGPKLPSRDLLDRLLRALSCTEEETEAVNAGYAAAYEDQIRRRRAAPRDPLIMDQDRIGRSHHAGSINFGTDYTSDEDAAAETPVSPAEARAGTSQIHDRFANRPALAVWSRELLALKTSAGAPPYRAMQRWMKRLGSDSSVTALHAWFSGISLPRHWHEIQPLIEMLISQAEASYNGRVENFAAIFDRARIERDARRRNWVWDEVPG